MSPLQNSRLTSSQLTAAELRREFDAAFAQPLSALAVAGEELLAVRLAGSAYAFRVKEVSGVFLRTQIVALPSDHPALLGLAGIRGVIVPVYSLALILGHPPSPEAPRWLALCAGSMPIALGFDSLEGHLRLAPAQLRAVGKDPLAQHIHQIADAPSGPRAIVDLPSVIASLAGKSGSP